MKKLLSFVIALFLIGGALPVQAQLKFGVKAGASFTHLDIDEFKTNNATGWFVGPTTEFVMPVVGIGLDASLLYSQRNTELGSGWDNDVWGRKYRMHYLTIPVNIRYKLPLPVIKPFIFAGPEFNFRLADNGSDFFGHVDDILDRDPLDSKGAEVNFNVGAGVELFDRVDVFFNYNAGLTNVIKHLDSKSSQWRVGGTLYF